MEVKPWQIVLIVAGLGVLVAGAWYSRAGSQKVKLPHRVYMIDVTTGRTYVADTSKRAVMIPAEHPETGLLSLLPMRQGEDGKWTVSPRYLSAIDGSKIKVEAVDPRTGAVLVEVGEHTTYRRE